MDNHILLCEKRLRSANKKVYKRKCDTCGTVFKTTSKSKIRCSDYCRDVARGAKQEDTDPPGDVIGSIAEKMDVLINESQSVEFIEIGEIL